MVDIDTENNLQTWVPRSKTMDFQAYRQPFYFESKIL